MLGKRKSAYPSATKKATKYRKSFKKQTLAKHANERIHFVRRHCDYFSFLTDNLSPTFNAWTFRLSNVPAAAELTALYDQFKICGVLMTFRPSQTNQVNNDTVGTAGGGQRFLSAIDYSDTNPPTTMDQLREYESCQVTSILETHQRYIKNPKFKNASGQCVSDWVATDTPTLIWSGLKTAVETVNSTGVPPKLNYTVECVFYLCFKNIK